LTAARARVRNMRHPCAVAWHHAHVQACRTAPAFPANFDPGHTPASKLRPATSLKLAHVQSDAAINMGVALTLRVRAARQGPVAGADQAPGPHSHSSSACLDDRVSDTRAKRTRRWHISKSTSHGACDGDVTLAAGVSRRGARTRRCSRAAAAV